MLQRLLGHAGAFDIKDGPTGWYGSRTGEAIKGFQKQNGLEVDGVLNPGGRTLDTLRRYSTDGEMPRWIAADITDRGPQGVATARDLVERMKTENPQRASGLTGAIYDALAGPHKGAFTGGATSATMALAATLGYLENVMGGEDGEV